MESPLFYFLIYGIGCPLKNEAIAERVLFNRCGYTPHLYYKHLAKKVNRQIAQNKPKIYVYIRYAVTAFSQAVHMLLLWFASLQVRPV